MSGVCFSLKQLHGGRAVPMRLRRDLDVVILRDQESQEESHAAQHFQRGKLKVKVSGRECPLHTCWSYLACYGNAKAPVAWTEAFLILERRLRNTFKDSAGSGVVKHICISRVAAEGEGI